jgi:periplasmic copper chaperone A
MRLSLLFVCLTLAACGAPDAPQRPEAPPAVSAVPQGLEIRDAWASATPGGVDVSAGYFTIANGGAADRLVALSSPRAARVEVHEMSVNGNVMRMRAIEGGLEAPAGGVVTLAPGGLHLMFTGVTAPFTPGEEIPVTLTFERAGVREITLQVRAGGPYLVRERQRSRVLQVFEHDRAFHVGDGGAAQQLALHDLLKMRQIARDDFHQIIRFSCQHDAERRLRHTLHNIAKRPHIRRRMIAQAHADDGRAGEPDALRIHQADHGAQHAALLEPGDAPRHHAGRNPRRLRQLRLRDPCVALQRPQQSAVGIVEGRFCTLHA